MRVIVTRPEFSARRTAARLAELGHTPVLLPMSRPVHKPEVALEALQAPHAALAITSAEAIRALSLLGPVLAGHLATPLLAVGRATAEAAIALGFTTVIDGGGSGTQLAEAAADYLSAQAQHLSAAPHLTTGHHLSPQARPVPAAPQPSPQACPPSAQGHHLSAQGAPILLYLAGKPRSPHFETGLAARNIGFSTAEIYEMLPTNHDAATLRHALGGTDGDDGQHSSETKTAVLLYSKETARLFFSATESQGKTLASMRFLCLSEAVAAAIPATFARRPLLPINLTKRVSFAFSDPSPQPRDRSQDVKIPPAPSLPSPHRLVFSESMQEEVEMVPETPPRRSRSTKEPVTIDLTPRRSALSPNLSAATTRTNPRRPKAGKPTRLLRVPRPVWQKPPTRSLRLHRD